MLQNWNMRKIDEQDGFTAFLQPLPRTHVMEVSTAPSKNFIFIWKLALFGGEGREDDSTLDYVKVTVLERKDRIWGKLQLWTFLSGSRDHNAFQLAEIMFCYCFLVGKWMRRCWTKG